jgi:hypothetical protein
VEFWLNWFYVHDFKRGKLIVAKKIQDQMDSFYEFCYMTQPDIELTALVSHIDE